MPDSVAMKAAGFCIRPDRDVPKIQCGYPLPCPHHPPGAIIELGSDTTTIVPLSLAAVAALPRLREIAERFVCQKSKRRRELGGRNEEPPAGDYVFVGRGRACSIDQSEYGCSRRR
jgi:hypothetical protein